MDPVSELENAIGAELLRAAMLRAFPPSIGKRYILEKFLGRGASGLVVAARDDRLDRPIALKLRPAGEDTSMLAEARALARLDHPNVVRVHDVDIVEATFDRRPFRLWMVSMQRVAGRTLRTWLAEKPRSHDEIIEVFLAAGGALEAAHAERIVHRDFKPDNVLVRTDGVAQVIDFGFAVPAMSSRVDRDLGFGVAGTEAYMSPEAKRGRPTAKSDQYAFAISLVEALTGAPTKPGFIRPGSIPRGTWRVVRRATRTSARRYPNMTALLEDLDAARRTSPFWVQARRNAAIAVLLFALGRWAKTHPDVVADFARRAERGFHAAFASTDPTGEVANARPPAAAAPATGRAPPSAPLPFQQPTEHPVAAASAVVVAPGTAPACVPRTLLVLAHSERRNRYGCYEVVVSQAGADCLAEAAKHGSSTSRNCWGGAPVSMPTTISTDDEGTLVIEAEHPQRVYSFHIPREGTSGRFSTSDGDDGTLEILLPDAGATAP